MNSNGTGTGVDVDETADGTAETDDGTTDADDNTTDADDGAAEARHGHDPTCDVAHGTAAGDTPHDRVLVAVYATPMASCLLRWGAELGFHTVLVEPSSNAGPGSGPGGAELGFGDDVEVVSDPATAPIDRSSDVVVTDHHRDDLGPVLAPFVRARPRWIGILGAARHTGPHIAALRAEGVDDELIATVRRPIGVDIGSRTPPEIALSVLAGLLADRNGRDAGLPELPRLPSATAT